MVMIMLIFFILAPVSLLKFIMNFKHLLTSLLVLEFLSLLYFMGFCLNLQGFELSSLYMLYFLVMLVCEGVLGLCLLVLCSFNYGSDYLYSFNSLSC